MAVHFFNGKVLIRDALVAMDPACCCCPCMPDVVGWNVVGAATSDVAEFECTLEDGCNPGLADESIDVTACDPLGPSYTDLPVIRKKTRITNLSILDFDMDLLVDQTTCCFEIQDIVLGTITRTVEVDVADPNEYANWMLSPCYGSRPTPITLTATTEYDVSLEITCNTVRYKITATRNTDTCDILSQGAAYFGLCTVTTGDVTVGCDAGESECCMPDIGESCPVDWTNTSNIQSCVSLTWTPIPPTP